MDDPHHEQTGWSKPLTKPLPKSNSSRTEQLRQLISQSYRVFNVYGKTPEDMKTVLLAFSLALEGIQTDDINAAFREWLQEQSAMPTPADIRKIAVRMAKDRSDRAGRRPQAWKPDQSPFVQVIRDRTAGYDGPILDELPPGRHLAPLDIQQRWPDTPVQVSYRRAE